MVIPGVLKLKHWQNKRDSSGVERALLTTSVPQVREPLQLIRVDQCKPPPSLPVHSLK